MSFNLLNKRLALCDGPGKWLQWVKEPMLKHIPHYTRSFNKMQVRHTLPLTVV